MVAMSLTSLRRPEVKEGDSTLRILFQCSSSAMDTASYSCPFRRKFCTEQEEPGRCDQKQKHVEWTDGLCFSFGVLTLRLVKSE